MNLKSLTQQAKGLFHKRGGTDALKEDAGELRDIARGDGSLTDKAKAATDALKDPGAKDQPGPTQPAPTHEPHGADRPAPPTATP